MAAHATSLGAPGPTPNHTANAPDPKSVAPLSIPSQITRATTAGSSPARIFGAVPAIVRRLVVAVTR